MLRWTSLVLGAPDTTDPAGWAMGALLRSMRRVLLVTAAGWQLAMILAAFASLGVDAWPLALSLAALCALSLIALRFPVPVWAITTGMYALGLWSYLASSDLASTLVFTASWQINFASCIAGLLIGGRAAVPLVVGQGAAIAATLLVALPQWGVQTPLAVALTQTSIVAAVRLALPSLLRLAAQTDRAAAEAEEATRRAELGRRVSARTAEESRVLHDTAINTLGAIANGGAGVEDEAGVRRQCVRDVALLRALRSERPLPAPAGLHEIFGQPGLPVERRGLSDEAVERVSRRLAPEVVAAIVGGVREAVTNAAKHSGADRVEITVELDADPDRLRILVRDEGRGFEGDARTDRGIGGSILGRAAEQGIEATVIGRLGAGTEVQLVVPLPSGDAVASSDEPSGGRADADDALRASITALQRRAGDLWGIAVAVVGIVLTLAGGTNEHLALYPMIGLMLLAWALCRIEALRRARRLLSALLALLTLAVFLLSAVATGFGTIGPIHWQALAPTGPLVLLVSLDAGRRILALVSVALAALVTVIAALVLPVSAAAAQIVVGAGAVAFGFAVVWTMFRAYVTRLGVQTALARSRVFAAELSAELDAAAQASYRSWLDSGLDSAVELMNDIARGARPPHDPETRRACGEEERYLRQLLQISPELVHLRGRLMPTLRYARSRGIAYLLRLGGADAPDEESAHHIASTVLRNLTETDAGQTLSASLFPVQEGLQLTLTGGRLTPPTDSVSRMRYERLGPIELLELTYAAPAVEEPDRRPRRRTRTRTETRGAR